jgi:hypothetical protein
MGEVRRAMAKNVPFKGMPPVIYFLQPVLVPKFSPTPNNPLIINEPSLD